MMEKWSPPANWQVIKTIDAHTGLNNKTGIYKTKKYKENGDCKLKGIIKNANQQQNSLNSTNWTIFYKESTYRRNEFL